MDLIEAINEMKTGKVVHGSNRMNYRIKDETIEYFYEQNWSKTTLSILDLTELQFEKIETEKKETLSDKIRTFIMGKNMCAVAIEDGEEFKIIKKEWNNLKFRDKYRLVSVSDVKEFIKQLKSSKNRERMIDNPNAFIDEIAGDRFK